MLAWILGWFPYIEKSDIDTYPRSFIILWGTAKWSPYTQLKYISQGYSTWNLMLTCKNINLNSHWLCIHIFLISLGINFSAISWVQATIIPKEYFTNLRVYAGCIKIQSFANFSLNPCLYWSQSSGRHLRPNKWLPPIAEFSNQIKYYSNVQDWKMWLNSQ